MEYRPNILSSRRHLAVILLQTLREKGFMEEYHGDEGDITREKVFTFPVNKRDRFRVAVYTSIVKNADEFEVRESGDDAIRVVLLYRREKDGKEMGLYKATRINRTGDTDAIADRVLERAREAYARGLKPDRCPRCGAPTFVSKKGKTVCAEICWERKPSRENPQ